MAIYTRGKNKTWWVRLTPPNGGKPIQKTTGTTHKREAQEFHDRLKSELWRVKHFDAKIERTWPEAVVRWSQEQGHRKSPEDDLKYLRWLDPYLRDKTLGQIDRRLIDHLKAEKLKTGVCNATVNHVLGFLRSVLNRARDDWEWIETRPTITLLPESTKRVRWITHEEAERLFKELTEHVEPMARFTLATGLRMSNVTGLQWDQIDMQRRCAWVHGDQAKSGHDLAVPLNADALAVIRQQLGKHPTNVFTYKGRPIQKANRGGWRDALKRAGIEDFRWHDLRHTWASWHIQNGTPLKVLQELGGWANLSMVMRYAHLSSDHLMAYADNVSEKRAVTNLLQVANAETLKSA